MHPVPYKYAAIPQFTYQSVQCQYQTYDWEKSQFASYSINDSTERLTGGNDQDNKDPNTEESKEEPPAEAEAAVEEPSPSPTEGSENPESTGEYDQSIGGKTEENKVIYNKRIATHLRDRTNRGINSRRTN